MIVVVFFYFYFYISFIIDILFLFLLGDVMLIVMLIVGCEVNQDISDLLLVLNVECLNAVAASELYIVGIEPRFLFLRVVVDFVR